MKVNSIRDLKSISQKRVFLRLDLNVPIEKGKILDDYKIEGSLPTLCYLLKHKTSVVIASHLGKPKGKKDASLSLKPLAKALSQKLGLKVKFVEDISSVKAKKTLSSLKPGEVALLENLRFFKGELDNDNNFAKKLASLSDVYVNDALAVSHRQQASVSAIKKYLPAFAGLLLERELKVFERVLKPKKPMVLIMGGAKIDSKAPLIKAFYNSANQILLGGGLANSFFSYEKKEIGKSLSSPDSVKVIKALMRGKKQKNKMVLPIDVIVRAGNGKIKLKQVEDVLKTDTIFDIGPETITLFSKHIKKAQTLIWNGPMGKFEEKVFASGSLAVARLIASRSSGRAYGIVGGGETVSVLKKSGMMEYVDWVSTAGGAMMTYLSGQAMPGLDKIIKK